MSVNNVSRFNPYRVHPISSSDGSLNEEDCNPRYTPKKENKPVNRRMSIPKGEELPQPYRAGILLSRWV